MSTLSSPDQIATDTASYDRWYRAKVQAALDDTRAGISHDAVMADMLEIIEARLRAHASRDLEPRG